MSNLKLNRIRDCRQQNGWSQQQLADLAGIPRTSLAAIEQGRLLPAVTTAMAIAKVLECSVESLFDSQALPGTTEPNWIQSPGYSQTPFWEAEIDGSIWKYPCEPLPTGTRPFDGGPKKAIGRGQRNEPSFGNKTLVVASCDPAVGILASEYERQTSFRLLALSRNSRSALQLLREGKAHVAGVHLSGGADSKAHRELVHSQFSQPASLLRLAVWQAGVAFAKSRRCTSVAQLKRGRWSWVGREVGSGARECLETLFDGRFRGRKMAKDHRSVAQAISLGWADAGVCLEFTARECGLNFLPFRQEAFDLCLLPSQLSDRRVKALIEVVQSPRYRSALQELPGYETQTTGTWIT